MRLINNKREYFPENFGDVQTRRAYDVRKENMKKCKSCDKQQHYYYVDKYGDIWLMCDACHRGAIDKVKTRDYKEWMFVYGRIK